MAADQTELESPAPCQELTATWHRVPDESLVGVEHPCLIKDVRKAIQSLGGERKIAKAMQSEAAQTSIGVSLRPHDVMRKPIPSAVVRTNNILLKISVPKRTGRKRKRGSQCPFTFPSFDSTPSHDDHKSSQYSTVFQKPSSTHVGIDEGGSGNSTTDDSSVLLQSLRDNPKKYDVDVVGIVRETHRFRNLPDFAFSTYDSSLVKQITEHVTPFDYTKIKGFHLDKSRAMPQNEVLIPPPTFSDYKQPVPFNYGYLQNAGVRVTVDEEGKLTSVNSQAAPRISSHMVPYDIPEVPTGPHPDVIPESQLDTNLRKVIADARALMEKRPIMTRRVALNHFSRDIEYTLKYAFQYLGYMFRSGPWREAIIKFGVDPRSDPKYRIYQTMTYKIATRGADAAESAKWVEGRVKYVRSLAVSGQKNLKDTHVFDGTKIQLDGKTWQVCDVTDPLLRSLLDTDNIRSECDAHQDGWYQNGTWAKVRTIMRDKINILAYTDQQPYDGDYDRIRDLPDVFTKENMHLAILGRGEVSTDRDIKMFEDLRRSVDINRTVGGASNRRPEGVGDDRGRLVSNAEGGVALEVEGEEGDGGREGDQMSPASRSESGNERGEEMVIDPVPEGD